ncbi:MAG: Fe-S protein assembly co-chaperone HscB [Burkholderiaceae bacterium]
MRLDSDDYELFGLPRRQTLDLGTLDTRWRELQAEVHPDRFVSQGTAAQRVAMQWAVRVNEAYRRLKDPLQRAAYLCRLADVDVGAEDNTAMPAAFLVEQMQWREALDDADSLAAVQALADQVARRRDAGLKELEQALDVANEPANAAAIVRGLMFIDRYASDVDRRLEALGH